MKTIRHKITNFAVVQVHVNVLDRLGNTFEHECAMCPFDDATPTKINCGECTFSAIPCPLSHGHVNADARPLAPKENSNGVLAN